MTPRQQSRQTGVFSVPLERIVDPKHSLCVLAGQIDWNDFDTAFGSLYHPANGRPGTPTRLMVGEALVDKGYRGHDYVGSSIVHVAKRWMKKLARRCESGCGGWRR